MLEVSLAHMSFRPLNLQVSSPSLFSSQGVEDSEPFPLQSAPGRSLQIAFSVQFSTSLCFLQLLPADRWIQRVGQTQHQRFLMIF